MSNFVASYSALLNHFRELYGTAGRCLDVQGFLYSASSVVNQLESSSAPVPTNANRPAVPVTVFIQVLEGSSLSSLDDAVAVLNRAYSGCGWLSARHATGNEPFHVALRKSLRSWLVTLAAPAEPVDLLLSADCNPLQAHPRLTERILVLPSEPSGGDGSLALRDTWLRCNEKSGQLEMLHGQTIIAPVYLGSTVPNPALGPMYWLTVLASPYRLRAPGGPMPRDEIVPDVRYSPRRKVGLVVVERATWLISTERLRRVWFGRKGARRTADVAIDCAKLGIPRVSFVRAANSGNRPQPQERKPMWIDSRNPLMLDLLGALLPTSESLVVTEALPERSGWPNSARERTSQSYTLSSHFDREPTGSRTGVHSVAFDAGSPSNANRVVQSPGPKTGSRLRYVDDGYTEQA